MDAPLKLDAALATLARSPHDADAWRALYLALYPRTLAQAYRLLGGDRAAAQDACHDAFVRLLNLGGLDRFESADDLGRYFSVVVRNVCLDRLRSTRHLVHQEPDEHTAGADVDAEGAARAARAATDDMQALSPEDGLELRELVASVASGLSPPEQLLLQLMASGYSTPEVAARLGLSYENAAVRMHRLRKKLHSSRNAPSD